MTGSLLLPEWQCHKRVRAAQIIAISDAVHIEGQRLMFDNGASVYADATWAKRHDAKVGGYYIVYEDGYTSYSPQAAFESGYTPLACIPQPTGA